MRSALNWRPEWTRRHLLGRLAGGLVAASLPRLAASDAPASQPVRFGVFPYLPALEIGRQFGRMASAFATVLERPVSLQTKSGFPAFRAALREASYDIALLHPFLYADAVSTQDYRPLARLKEDLAGVIVGTRERKISRFRDLLGETIAVPPPLSAVSQLVKQELRQAGLDGPGGVTLAYHRTKTACIHAVVAGKAAGCAVPGFVLGQLAAFAPVALEAKFQTTAIAGILFVGHGRLGDSQLALLQRTMLGWDQSPEGRRLLEGPGWSGIGPIEPGQYDLAELQLWVD